MKSSRTEFKLLLLCVLIGLVVAGCGTKSASERTPSEDSQESPVQIKKTEDVGELETSQGQEEQLPTDLPLTDEPTNTIPPKQIFPDPTKPAVISDGENEYMVSVVKADLASRLGVSQEEITVVSVEAVTWNDSSLGCPSGGGNYLQVLTPGYKIILSVDGVEYAYHTDDADKYLLCNNLSL